MTGSRSEVVDASSERWTLSGESAASSHRRTLVELTQESDTGMDFEVRGDCMAPLFRDGDHVRVEARRLYLPGDVIAFLESEAPADVPIERLLVHRLLGYDLRGGRVAFVTGADAAIGFDPPFTRDRILGRVHSVAAAGDELPRYAALRISPGARLGAFWRFLKLARPALMRRLFGRKV